MLYRYKQGLSINTGSLNTNWLGKCKAGYMGRKKKIHKEEEDMFYFSRFRFLFSLSLKVVD